MSLLTFLMVCTLPKGAMFKIWLKSNEFKGIKNPSKIDDIPKVLAGVDDNFVLPDLG